jgi:recombination protein RecR
MIDKLPALQAFMRELQQVPYLASKNLLRVSHHFLEMDPVKREKFCAALTALHEQIEKCPVCWAWKERSSSCLICAPSHREQTIICVVETWHDLYAIEKTGAFKGSYHILGGALYPLEGVGPDDLSIPQLKERVRTGVQEIILAMNQTPEGEATAAFVVRSLQGSPVTITCLARGVPVGSSLEFMDRLTVHKAITERRSY